MQPAFDMVEVPPGRLAMRDDRTGRSWVAEVAALRLGRCPVTQADWQALIGSNPSRHEGATHPVETISWFDAVDFCNAASHAAGLPPRYARDGQNVADLGGPGYRLPTEAEWEWACRAGSNGPRYGALDDIAWYAANSDGRPQPVGRRAPNDWGLHDMLGNVWEWCWDLYDPESYGAYRIFRGGGWADEVRGVLATNRRRSHPTFSIDDLGMRVARDSGS